MGADFSYDPVTAIDEAHATGETAQIFADIRDTMAIPLVTSIWRGLAGIENSLPAAWAAARPIYQSGLPAPALARVVENAQLPLPGPWTADRLAKASLTNQDLAAIRTIVSAYNRSNGMNLVVLAALVNPVTGSPPEPRSRERTADPQWPAVRPLMAQAEIAPATWEQVRRVNAMGAPGRDASVATLWRHLAHWPTLLNQVELSFSTLQQNGEVAAASARVVQLAADEARTMASLSGPIDAIAGVGLQTITSYVTQPTQVARMVTLGHMLARWLP